jgi:hypothetical protein
MNFPASRRAGHVRDVAAALLRKRGKAADDHWHRVVDIMIRRMREASIPETMIRVQIREFFAAVQVDLVRQARSDRRGGAA